MSRQQWVLWIVLLVVILDQAVKIWVKTSFEYGEEWSILGLDWAYIRFEENEGAAFSLNLGGEYGKLALSLFRLLAVVLIIWLLRRVLSEGGRRFMLFGFSLLLGGAIGNLIDSTFYGVLFSRSSIGGGVAEFLPEGGGYAPLFHGAVVDMFFFPIWTGTYPDWLPVVGGQAYYFFRPIFNLADVAIFIGVGTSLIALFKLGRGAASEQKDEMSEP